MIGRAGLRCRNEAPEQNRGKSLTSKPRGCIPVAWRCSGLTFLLFSFSSSNLLQAGFACLSGTFALPLQNGIEVLAFDAPILCGTVPIDSNLLILALGFPGSAISRLSISSSPVRRSKQCPRNTASSISAIFRQLPCVGVEWISIFSRMRQVSAGSNVS